MVQYQIRVIQRCPILIPHATHPDHLPKFLDQSGSTGLAADLLAKPGCGHYIIWVISETLFTALFTLRTSSPVAIIRCRCQLKRGEHDREEEEKTKEVHDTFFLE